MALDRYSFGGLLFTFIHEYDRLMRSFNSRTGLYPGQSRILTQLKDHPGSTLSELSEFTGVGMPSLSVSVRNLKKSGLIAAGGQRSRSLTLTQEGAAKAAEFHSDFDDFLKSFLESIGEESTDTLADGMRAMRDFMSDYASKHDQKA